MDPFGVGLDAPAQFPSGLNSLDGGAECRQPPGKELEMPRGRDG